MADPKRAAVVGERGAGAAVAKVHTTLRMLIVDGRIPPGTRVSIDAVARDLGVSQTPVREAFQGLESENLLVYTPARGYKTTPVLDRAGLRSMFEFRLLIEPWAAATASADTVDNPAGDLEHELRAFERVVARGKDVRQTMLAHDARFHDIILGAAGNPVARRAFSQTNCHLHVFRLLPVDVDGTITVREHREICGAIRSRDSAAADRVMREHIRNSFRRSAQAFEPASEHPGVAGQSWLE